MAISAFAVSQSRPHACRKRERLAESLSLTNRDPPGPGGPPSPAMAVRGRLSSIKKTSKKKAGQDGLLGRHSPSLSSGPVFMLF